MQVDKDLLDALKEDRHDLQPQTSTCLAQLLSKVSRSLTWLFNDSDTDFDNQLTYKQLKAGIQVSPVLPSFPTVSLRKLTAALGSCRSQILDNTTARDPAAGQTSCYKVPCSSFHQTRAQLATRLWAATASSSRSLLAKSSLSAKICFTTASRVRPCSASVVLRLPSAFLRKVELQLSVRLELLYADLPAE